MTQPWLIQKRLDPKFRLLYSAKLRSNKKNLEFDLDLEDIIIPDCCPVLNCEFEPNRVYCPSIDRIDNSKGYLKDNIQIISSRANTMKNAATVEELRYFARWVLNTYGDPDQEYLEMN